MSALYLHDIHGFLPPQQTLENLGPGLRLKRSKIKLLERYHKLKNICMDERGLTELLEKPLKRIVQEASFPDSVKYLVYSKTVLMASPFQYDIIGKLKSRCSLPDAHGFSLTMRHCGGSLVALALFRNLLSDQNDQAILLTGEKAFSHHIQVIDGVTVMGEGTAGVAFGRRPTEWKIAATHSSIDGQYSTHGESSGVARLDRPEALRAFSQNYTRQLADFLTDTIKRFNLTWDSLDSVIPHNVNESSWRSIAELVKLNPESIYLENVGKWGHCFGADPFLNLVTYLKKQSPAPGSKVLMVSVGLGATYSRPEK